jgi:cytidylate kinase
MHPVLCIDGPAAAGKSTVARAAAQTLGFLYVDSGALYRIVTWLALRRGVATNQPEALAQFAATLAVESSVRDGAVVYRVEGEEPRDELRTPEVNQHVSPVSAVPAVRARVTHWLRELRALGPLIVEGRDIGSVVFPDSPARFYLDADPEERARRRHLEDLQKGFAKPNAVEAVKASLLNRDRIDSSRKAAPLTVAPGAKVINTTALTVDAVVAAILAALPETWGRGG